MLKKSAAERVGFKADAPGVVAGGLSGGIGRDVAENWIAPFASFEIGGEKVTNTRLRVATINLPDSDMLLGADFFLSHRVLVPRIRTASTSPTTAARCSGSSAAIRRPGRRAAWPPSIPRRPRPSPAIPTDADGLARRAAAKRRAPRLCRPRWPT